MSDQTAEYAGAIKRAFWHWFGWYLLDRVTLGFAIGCGLASVAGLILVISHSVLWAVVVFFGFNLATAKAVEARNESMKHVLIWHSEFNRLRDHFDRTAGGIWTARKGRIDGNK